MKIFSNEQIRRADKFTIQHETISSIALMERAATAFTDWLKIKLYKFSHTVYIFCGTGNNGGDGLAVGRMLLEAGFNVQVFIVGNMDKRSEDFSINYDRIRRKTKINLVRRSADLPAIQKHHVIVDALFGSGLSRKIEGLAAEAVNTMNQSGARIFAIDIATGLYADQPTPPQNPIVQAHFTITFQLPKLAFMLAENAPYVGEWELVNIGLSQQFIDQEQTSLYFLDEAIVARLIRRRQKFAHKGSFGKVLLISGSYGKMGATQLAGQACLRSGTGLLTLYAPQSAYNILQLGLPEAMTLTDPEPHHLAQAPDVSPYAVIAAGPGLGQHPDTAKMLAQVLEQVTTPVVLDADALNILAANPALMHLLPKGSILTPHRKEFERLAGTAKHDFEKLEQLQQMASRHQVYMVLKGPHTGIATPNGKVYFNSTGNPGMATGGSGDVLTGIIAGLLAQQYEPLHAALLGTWLHGKAGDLAAEDLGQEAMLPTDLINRLPLVFKNLHQARKELIP